MFFVWIPELWAESRPGTGRWCSKTWGKLTLYPPPKFIFWSSAHFFSLLQPRLDGPRRHLRPWGGGGRCGVVQAHAKTLWKEPVIGDHNNVRISLGKPKISTHGNKWKRLFAYVHGAIFLRSFRSKVFIWLFLLCFASRQRYVFALCKWSDLIQVLVLHLSMVVTIAVGWVLLCRSIPREREILFRLNYSFVTFPWKDFEKVEEVVSSYGKDKPGQISIPNQVSASVNTFVCDIFPFCLHRNVLTHCLVLFSPFLRISKKKSPSSVSPYICKKSLLYSLS